MGNQGQQHWGEEQQQGQYGAVWGSSNSRERRDSMLPS